MKGVTKGGVNTHVGVQKAEAQQSRVEHMMWSMVDCNSVLVESTRGARWVGSAVWFYCTKGYGFIWVDDHSSKEIYVHQLSMK